MDEFPSNSKSSRSKPQSSGQQQERERRRKVVSQPVVVRKETWAEKILGFVGAGSHDILDRVVFGVLLPTAADAVFDELSDGLERRFEGIRGGGRGSRRGGGRAGYTSYGNISSHGHREDPREERRSTRRSSRGGGRGGHDLNTHEIRSRREANEIVELLYELVDANGEATVADLYDMLDIDPDFSDHAYGWVDLGNVGIRKSRNGYVLQLPRPIRLD